MDKRILSYLTMLGLKPDAYKGSSAVTLLRYHDHAERLHKAGL